MAKTANERVLAAAHEWIGTPYRHQGSRRGVGCDCLGLVRGLWREIYGEEPESPGNYAPDWAERSGKDRLHEAAKRHLLPVEPRENMQPGDLLLFRWRDGYPAKHAGILAEGGRFIHAWEHSGVVSSPLVPAWRRRLAHVFRFPEINEMKTEGA
ncbi:NlpC/P60 family protein [Rhizobium sp. L1K21]|uniref:NlpC/P60 family protein n=1 Tax=Rhizobium sp. L1K21 TaxID=2954933 RepID=UPI0020921A41|nr:NlpC/P60 family protein [Rhizobium sp. L1K21]MCO6186682.1 NlpC/P60 family protein [Rhizobium sp. L1K21]